MTSRDFQKIVSGEAGVCDMNVSHMTCKVEGTFNQMYPASKLIICPDI